MNRKLLFLAFVGLVLYYLLRPAPEPACPPPAPRPVPQPIPPDKPRSPWGIQVMSPVGDEAPEGDDEPTIDLLAIPKSGRPRNVGGRDGAGLCVFTSIQYAAWWQNEPRLRDFQAKMRQEPGGGYPEKVDRMIAKYGAGTRYIQYEGNDPAIIELALRTGRVPCITWQANHMLNCVHLDATKAAIVDNNAPDRVQWFPRNTFLSKWRAGGGGWVVVLLNSPPPPPPRGLRQIGCRPHEKPGVSRSATQVTVPGGVFWNPPQNETWYLNGSRVTASEVIAATLEDDSSRLHLTFIGPKVERDQALMVLGSLTAQYHVQGYEPTDWEVSCGFVTSGKPSIYLQDRTGRVLLRLESPRGLASALRRADPSYNPAKDPQGGPLPFSLPFDPKTIPAPVWVVGVLALFLLLNKEKSQ